MEFVARYQEYEIQKDRTQEFIRVSPTSPSQYSQYMSMQPQSCVSGTGTPKCDSRKTCPAWDGNSTKYYTLYPIPYTLQSPRRSPLAP